MFFNRLKGDFCPCPIATNFSPVIDYELKFVKMYFSLQWCCSVE